MCLLEHPSQARFQRPSQASRGKQGMGSPGDARTSNQVWLPATGVKSQLTRAGLKSCLTRAVFNPPLTRTAFKSCLTRLKCLSLS